MCLLLKASWVCFSGRCSWRAEHLLANIPVPGNGRQHGTSVSQWCGDSPVTERVSVTLSQDENKHIRAYICCCHITVTTLWHHTMRIYVCSRLPLNKQEHFLFCILWIRVLNLLFAAPPVLDSKHAWPQCLC